MEQVGRKGRVLFVNDSKATNADFGRAGARLLLRHFLDRRRQAEDRRHRLARGLLSAHPQGLPDRRGGGRLCRRRSKGRCRTWSPARSTARSSSPRAMPRRPTSTEPVVLLSPACASFDQYRNFEVRGDTFRELVRALPGVT